MGEFHYTRGLREDWEAEILKIKVGGVQIVSTYIALASVIAGTVAGAAARVVRSPGRNSRYSLTVRAAL
jgi:hypothetical protein